MNEEPVWFHSIVTTYGAWLQGDSRGFRTRHHREHVEGDYKNPAQAGQYDCYLKRSEAALKQDEVVFDASQREMVGVAIRDKLQKLGALVLCISVNGQHVHVLAKMPIDKPRNWIGQAKKHVWFELRDRGWVGQVWGKRGKNVLIENREHQLNTYGYILDHIKEGAWVWFLMNEKPPSPPVATGG